MSGRQNQNRKRFARLKRKASLIGVHQQKALPTDYEDKNIDQSPKIEACLPEVKEDDPQPANEMFVEEDSVRSVEEKVAGDIVDAIIAELSQLPTSSSLLSEISKSEKSPQNLLQVEVGKSTLLSNEEELMLFCGNSPGFLQSKYPDSSPVNKSTLLSNEEELMLFCGHSPGFLQSKCSDSSLKSVSVTSTSASMSGYLPDDEHNCDSNGCTTPTTLTSSILHNVSIDHVVDSYSNSASSNSARDDYPRNCQLELSTTSSECDSPSTKSHSSESTTLSTHSTFSTTTYFTSRSRSQSPENAYHSADSSASSKSTSSA